MREPFPHHTIKLDDIASTAGDSQPLKIRLSDLQPYLAAHTCSVNRKCRAKKYINTTGRIVTGTQFNTHPPLPPLQIRPSRPSQTPPVDWPPHPGPDVKAPCAGASRPLNANGNVASLFRPSWAQTRFPLEVLESPRSNKVLRYGSCAPGVGLDHPPPGRRAVVRCFASAV
ncbi:hypothetical protein BDP55DRAFT_629139 [Colletotrichum godetiae]|uniref:Uncharacterized protein n=1 Tax=Colletotrichum godetiae TaxID=1209918 RepID=A0AAJ0AUN2_9PEZI|nr:uncharacterized protein BDP55DRAFT_629139 [Colletotrichum godetiae]KAK1689165.1 hypothetical protein BDP55DRAFT_629139 [Colletotrichum godetiae]